MSNVVVVAPHPDDETLGCGGTLLRTCQLRGRRSLACRNRLDGRRLRGGFRAESGGTNQSVAEAFPIVETHNLSLPSAAVDMTPRSEIVGRIGETFSKIRPEILYLPFGGNVHSDHSVVFEAAVACTKWFRYPSIKSVLCYETLSETDLNIDPHHPRSALISTSILLRTLNGRLRSCALDAREMGPFPFPRSDEAIAHSPACMVRRAGLPRPRRSCS